MDSPIAKKLGVGNLGPVYRQTNNVKIHTDQQIALIYSDPLPDLSAFQGRGDAINQLKTWLSDESTSIIGILGEGGIGKSSLGSKVFAECEGFEGKFRCDIRAGTSITELARRALKEFGVLPDQVDALEETNLIPRLLRRMQQGRYLLFIDNLESALSAEGIWKDGYDQFFATFQDYGSQSVVLLASREYPPQYFAWRKFQDLRLNQGLTPEEGTTLLSSLEVEDADQHGAEISKQVQGHPLALSLIAGWICQSRTGNRSLKLLEQFDDLFEVTGRHRGENQISVDRVLQWSIERLSHESQFLLTQVSVFRGGFSAEAASALIENESITSSEVIGFIEDMERRALVQRLQKSNRLGHQFFQIQSRVKDFIQKKFKDLSRAHELAIAYFWAHRQQEFAAGEAREAVFEYEETFHHEFQLQRYFDAAQTVTACNAFLSRRGLYKTIVELYSQLHFAWNPQKEELQSYTALLGNLGLALDSLGQYQKAIELHSQHNEISRKIGDRHGEASSLGNLGKAFYSLGKYQKVIEFQSQSIEIFREIGNRYGEAASLDNLGSAYQALGQYQKAIELHLKSLEIKREIGDRNGEAISLVNLGNTCLALGQYQKAIELQSQSIEMLSEIGNRYGEARAFDNLGIAYQALGQYQKAIELHLKSLEIKCDISDRNGEAMSLANIGIAFKSLGQYQKAIDAQCQSLEIGLDIGDRSIEAIALLNMANAYAKLDRSFDALQNFERALEIYEELELEHRVKECKEAMAGLHQIIQGQRITAPTIGEAPKSSPDWLEKSLPVKESRPASNSNPRYQWLWYFLIGLGLAILIWWVKNQ